MDDAVPTPLPLPEEVTALRQRIAHLEAALAAPPGQDGYRYAQQIVETVREPLLVLRADFRVQSANPAFYQLFQVHPGETEGQLIYQLGHGQWDILAVRILLEEILPSHTVFNDYEVTHVFTPIGVRTLLLNARRLDHLPLILLAIEDITLRTQATLLRDGQRQEQAVALHHALAAHQRRDQEIQRLQHFTLLGRLAAGMAHELRNPLGALMLYVDVVEEELHQPAHDSAAEIAHALAAIKTNLARVDDLVHNYLSLIRVGGLQREPVDCGLLMRQCAREITPALTAHGITLQLEALDHLGPVALHQQTFRRVLLNLVHNALEAMPQGGTLTFRGQRHSGRVHLVVQDTGVGIPPEHYARIFEPLHTTKPGGTGLGLYIAQEVVAAHSGQITVQSRVGSGTTFTIMLPLAEA